jgi:hypothetical protein
MKKTAILNSDSQINRRNVARHSRNERGVLYFVANEPIFAERMLLSIYSLRKHYSGPVTIFCTANLGDLSSRIGTDERLMADISSLPIDAPSFFDACRTKATLTTCLPYEKNIFFDSDTTIHGDIDELFPQKDEIVLTPIHNFYSDDPKCKPTFDRWRQFCPELVRHLESERVLLINAGVIGMPRESSLYAAWRALMDRNTDINSPWPEEVGLWLLRPHHKHRLAHHKYNFWPGFGGARSATVVHYHNGSQTAPDYAELFNALRQEILDANIAGINQWQCSRTLLV